MDIRHSFLAAVIAPLLMIGSGSAKAGETLNEEATFACVIDKSSQSEPAKGHKLSQYNFRCVVIPYDPAMPMYTEDCVGNYEYKPDGSWKADGACTDTHKGGDKVFLTFHEGSHLNEKSYKISGGTGKFEGASGGGTYTDEFLTDTLTGGRTKGKIVLR